MRVIIPAILVGGLLAICGSSFAQDKPQRVAIISIQVAIAQSNDGQEAAKALGDKFAPKRVDLEKQQREISDLQNQLRNQEKTLSDEARTRLMRTMDDKTRKFNRDNEDATTEFQQAEQDAINEIGRKMMSVVIEHAQKNGITLVLDISSPQTPVLYADAGIDITEEIVELYNAATAEAETASSSATEPEATAEEAPAKPAEGAEATPKPTAAEAPPEPAEVAPAPTP